MLFLLTFPIIKSRGCVKPKPNGVTKRDLKGGIKNADDEDRTNKTNKLKFGIAL